MACWTLTPSSEIAKGHTNAGASTRMTAAKDAVSDKIDESKHNVCNIVPLHLSPDIVLTIITYRQRPTSTPTSNNLGEAICEHRDGRRGWRQDGGLH